jgi:hypothetical protein
MITTKRVKEILESFGEKEAATYAREHAKFPMLERWLFLTALWRMVRQGEAWVKTAKDSAANRMLARGVDPSDISALVRETQIDLLYEVCQLMDDPSHGIEDLQATITENVEWRLCEFDGEKGTVGRPMNDLHASFHSFEPKTKKRSSARKRGAS